jgi:hypothetical protein
MAGTHLCRLHHAQGRVEECPEEACPFWDPGGAVLPGRCAVELVDLKASPELVAWLLSLRRDLETARSAEETTAARRLFHGLLDELESE